MSGYVEKLMNLKAEKPFFIGFDSDGCVFDSMDIKHKECFCPAFIGNYDLQGASRAGREVWEFVNLYSKTRGLNRFLALIRSIELLKEHPDVIERGLVLPDITALKKWTEKESKLGEKFLAEEVSGNPDPELVRALNWSEDVSAAVKRIIKNLPPFPQVKDILERTSEKADLLVVSQTPVGDLEREWSEYGISGYVRTIAGQEMGTKTEHLKLAASGKYDQDKILMIGDAPGDYKAASANNALFYPVIPGSEEESWERLKNEALDRFFSGTYKGSYQDSLLEDFDKALPEKAPWQK